MRPLRRAVQRTDDPAQEAPVLPGYIVDNAHAVGRRPDGRTVLEVTLGDAVLDQLAALGAYDEGDEDAEGGCLTAVKAGPSRSRRCGPPGGDGDCAERARR